MIHNIHPETDIDPADLLPEATLAGLPESIQGAVANAGWKDLTPVQAKAIPYLLTKRDVMVQSRTGSGKTGAFVLPMLELLDPAKTACQALVLVPTRELAKQVATEAAMLFGDSGLKVVAVYGGVGYGPQVEAFKSGVQFVVGTPGRILDHLLNRSLSLSELGFLIFDEADRMLSIGFYPDMKALKRYLPEGELSTFMTSATYPQAVINLAGEFLREKRMLSLSRDHVHVAETSHVLYETPRMGKVNALMRIIEMENPDSAIIFCNTKSDVHFVSEVLRGSGLSADELSSDLTQAARERVLQKVREGRLRFLVATDVAARGIDIPELTHVFLYGQPEDPESYVHRAGRTGRAGASGTVITLADIMEKLQMKRLAKMYSIDLEERAVPTEEEVQTILSERATALLEARIREMDHLRADRLRRFLPLARQLGQSEDELPLLAMLLEEFYLRETGRTPQAPEPEAPREQPAALAAPDQDTSDAPRKRRRRKHKKPGGEGAPGSSDD